MASNHSGECIVEYAPWRAVGALVFPIVILLIPLGNLFLDPADFKARYIDEPISTAGLILALAWCVYAVWPGAIRQLRQGNRVTVDDQTLTTADGRRFELGRLRELSIERPFLRHPRIRARFIDPADGAVINTAFQSLESKLSVDEIVERIRRRVAN